MRRFYYTEEGEDDDGGQDDDGDGDEGKAYSLSETASLSFRCSSRPSANPLLLSVASTHLNKRKWNKISVTRKINHPISRFFSTPRCSYLFPSSTPSPSLSTRSNFSLRF